MKFARTIAVTVLLASIISFVAQSSEPVASAWAPAQIPVGFQEFLAPCTADTDLDCIESVGAVINGAEVKGTLTGRTGPSAEGGICCHEWRIPGLVNEDGRDVVETQAQLTGNDVYRSPCSAKCLVGLKAGFYATPIDGFRPQWESKLDTCGPTSGRVNGVCSRYGNLQEGVTYFMVMRSSWVLPSILSSKNAETKSTVTKLGSDGAVRTRVEGIPYRTLGVDSAQMNSVDSPTSRGAWASRSFNFTLLDGRQFLYYAGCAEKPTLVVGDNTWGPSVPTFSTTTGALDLRVMNPHFDTDGTTLFTGAYQSRIPMETAKCLWGPAITSTKQFKASVFEDSTGASKTAVTSIGADGDTFRIDVSGFTFSSPTIRVEADDTPAAATPTGTPTAPSRPTGARVTTQKGSVTVSVTRAASVTYSATAVRGRSTKKLSCRTSSSRVTCSVKNLAAGTWKLTVTPTNTAGRGTPYVKSVRVP